MAYFCCDLMECCDLLFFSVPFANFLDIFDFDPYSHCDSDSFESFSMFSLQWIFQYWKNPNFPVTLSISS